MYTDIYILGDDAGVRRAVTAMAACSVCHPEKDDGMRGMPLHRRPGR